MPVIGPFDRRISLETKTVVQDATGHPVETWTEDREVWANRRDATSNERFRASQELATRTAVYTVRWFADLNAGIWRIVEDGVIYDIEGLSEPPYTRRQYWTITASATGT